MKNLNEIVEKIWAQELPQKKRELLHDMVNYSDAKKKTKDRAHVEIDRIPEWKLDDFAKNYMLSGYGHKVITSYR